MLLNDYIAKPLDEKVLYNKIVGFVKNDFSVRDHIKEEKGRHEKIKYTDLEYLIHHTKSSPTLMMEMISLYLEQTPTLVDTMKKSLHDNDWKSLYSSVHKLIPSFSIMGINPNYEGMAKRVQKYASTQQRSDEILELVIQIKTVCMQACEELKEEYDIIKNRK